MSEGKKDAGTPRIGVDKGDDDNRALTEWTSEEELEREDKRIGGDETPKLGNPPG